MNDFMVCTGIQTLATSSSPASLTLPTDGNGEPLCRAMLIRATGNNANYTLDGTTPSTTVGMPLNTADTSPFWIANVSNIKRFQACAATGTGKIVVLYFN